MLTDTTAPRASAALATLRALAADPECDPAAYDAAHVLSALCVAARQIGGEDTHILHWLNQAPSLAAPRRILGNRATGTGKGRVRVAAALTAYDAGSAQARKTIRDIITTTIERAEA